MDVCLCGNAYFACYARVNILWVNLCVGWLLFCLLFCLPPRARSLLLSLVVNSYDYALFTNIISFNYRFDSLYNNFYRFFFSFTFAIALMWSCVLVDSARVFVYARYVFFFFWLMVVAALKFCFCFALVTGRGYQKDTSRREKSDNGDFSRTRYFLFN